MEPLGRMSGGVAAVTQFGGIKIAEFIKYFD